jgi:hypothetical protein
MKKTIVAAAVAAVFAAPAMADVSISGQINQEFFDNDSSTTGLGSERNADLVFSVSEDLGNGMKAFAKMVTTFDDNSNAATSDTDDGTGTTAGMMAQGSTQIIGLSGDFGTITMGKNETFIESAVAASAANDASEGMSNEVATGLGASAEATVEYTSPSFNGFTVVASGRGTADSNKDLDTTSIGFKYSNGPLTVMAAQADANDTADTQDTVVAAHYTMGDIKVGVVHAEVEASGATTDETWYGASYTMGANTFSISTKSSDTAGAEDDIYSIKHAMSKNVNVYLVHLNDEAGTADQTAVGMQVKF